MYKRQEAEGCTLQKNVQSGVLAVDAAEVVVRGCHSTDNGMRGFAAELKATLTASDCSASGCKGTGFLVFTGARAVLKKCPAATNGNYGVYAGGEGLRMEAEGCTLQKNVQSGVLALDAAEVVVRYFRSTDNGNNGLWAQTKATLTAIQGFVKGNQGTDCGNSTGGRLEMQRVEVDGVMTTSALGSKSKWMRRLRGLI